MARIRAVASTGGTEVAYAGGGSYRTILSLAPTADHILAIKGFSIAFDGTSVTAAPVLVRIAMAPDQGTSLTGVTLYEETLHGVTLSTHATAWKAHTVEPSTETKIYRVYNVHPQTGIEVRFSADDEILLKGASNAFCIAIAASSSVNATAHIAFEA